MLLVFEPIYLTILNLVKLSLLFMYYRIFPMRDMRIGCYILGGISIAWNIVLTGVAEGRKICLPLEM